MPKFWAGPKLGCMNIINKFPTGSLSIVSNYHTVCLLLSILYVPNIFVKLNIYSLTAKNPSAENNATKKVSSQRWLTAGEACGWGSCVFFFGEGLTTFCLPTADRCYRWYRDRWQGRLARKAQQVWPVAALPFL